MGPDVFWDMTLYEWSLWLAKIRSDQEKRIQDRDFSKALVGEFMALYANCHRDIKVKGDPFVRKDFFLLTGEIEEKKEEAPAQTGEQLMEEAEIFKKKMHGRRNGIS